jgi:hypothetical protein
MIAQESIETFIDEVLRIAKEFHHPVERNRSGLRQIDSGHKKLHEDHIRRLYPAVLEPAASVSKLIDGAAPGRPCAHKPTREIIAKYKG